MNREKEISILNEMYTNLVNEACTLRYTYQEGQLKVINEQIQFVNEEGKSYFITYVPYDYENEKIDLRIRKRLAEEFLKSYPLDLLKAEYKKSVEKENEKYEKMERDYHHLETLVDRFTMFDSAEAKDYNSYPCIALTCEWKDIEYKRLCTESEGYEVLKTDEGYRLQKHMNVLEYTDFITLEDVLLHCNTIIEGIENKKIEAKARLEEYEKEEERKSNIRLIVNTMSLNNNIYIVKSKNTITGYEGRFKYSLKKGGVGKFYKADYLKLSNDILNGKITHYIKLDKETDLYKLDLKTIEFIAF